MARLEMASNTLFRSIFAVFLLIILALMTPLAAQQPTPSDGPIGEPVGERGDRAVDERGDTAVGERGDTALGEPSAAAAGEPADPYLWLEEVEGERALAWVEAP